MPRRRTRSIAQAGFLTYDFIRQLASFFCQAVENLPPHLPGFATHETSGFPGPKQKRQSNGSGFVAVVVDYSGASAADSHGLPFRTSPQGSSKPVTQNILTDFEKLSRRKIKKIKKTEVTSQKTGFKSQVSEVGSAGCRGCGVCNHVVGCHACAVCRHVNIEYEQCV